jgi:hypothetical protein
MDFMWVDDVDAVCLTLVEGADPQRVGEVLGVDGRVPRLTTFAEAEAQAGL